MSILKYTAEQLITTIRARANVRNTGATGTTDSDLIRYLNEEMMSKLAPLVMRIKEEYFVLTQRLSVTGATSRYRIPARTLGQKIRDLTFLDSNLTRYFVTRIQREDVYLYAAPTSNQSPGGFYIEGNYIVLVPESGSFSGTLEIAFFQQPGQLVGASEYRIITVIDTANKQITVNSTIPSTFTTTQKYDIHSFNSGAEVKLYDLTPDILSGTSMSFSDAIDGSTYGTYAPAIGDYVCLAGEAALPALPRELHIVLAQAAIVRITQSIGDFEGAQVHGEALNEMLQAAGYLIDDRIQGKKQKFFNRHSFIGGS